MPRFLRATALCASMAMLAALCLCTTAAHADVAVVFADSGLEAAVRAAISLPTGTIYQSQLLTLTQLDASSRAISTLSGIEYCTNLVVLDLYDNQISSATELATLSALTELDLGRNQLTNLSPLSAITSLERLYLDENGISDLSPLATLTNLDFLYLLTNNISDLSPLASLTALQELCLCDNAISDLAPLAGLSDLTDLNLTQNAITNLTPLAGLANLAYLYLDANNITDVFPLAGLTALSELHLTSNRITDISPLVANSGLTAGDYIYLYDNRLDLEDGTPATLDIQTLRDRGVQLPYVSADNQNPPPLKITVQPSAAPNPCDSAATVTCSVTAEDGLARTISYAWTATDAAGDPAGSFLNPAMQAPLWTAPANNTLEIAQYTLRITVTAGEDTVTASFLQQVRPVHQVTISAGPSGSPNPCNSAAEVACSVTATSNLGYDLTYAWTAVDAASNPVGSFSSTTAAAPIWTAPANLTGSPLNYTIAVTVSSEGEQATGSFTQTVNSVPHSLTITQPASGTPNPAESAAQVSCSVAATDSLAHPLSYLWSATDAFGNPAGSFDDASLQFPKWTAPANLTGTQAIYTLSVAVTCAGEPALTDSSSFTIAINPDHHQVTIIDGPSGAPNPVAAGAQVQCGVSAQDDLGGVLTYLWSATDALGNPAGTFDNSALQNPIWTAPADTGGVLAEYTIAVTASAVTGDSATKAYTQQVRPVFSHAFAVGARMVGIPCAVADAQSVNSLLGAHAVAWYDPVAASYLSDDAMPYVTARGYWARFDAPATAQFVGEPITGDFITQVKKGWNIVCSPYSQPVDLTSLWLSPTLQPFAWTDTGEGYELVADVDDYPGDVHHTLDPWCGYWVLSTVDCNFAWRDPATSAACSQLTQLGRADAELGGWQLQLTASAANLHDRFNYCGVASRDTARSLEIPNPPIRSGGLDLYFPSSNNQMATAFARPGGEPSWQFDVYCGMPGVDVAIAWPDLSVVPAQCGLTLTDLDTEASVNMRTARTYTFTAGGSRVSGNTADEGMVRHFQVVANTGARGSLLANVVDVRSLGGRTATIAYSLSAPSDITLEVRNIAGRIIRIQPLGFTAAGTHSTAFPLAGATGAPLPSGLYLCTLSAHSEDGSRFSTVRPLNVSR